LADLDQPLSRNVHLVVVSACSPNGNQATYFAPENSVDFAADIGLLPHDPLYPDAVSKLLDHLDDHRVALFLDRPDVDEAQVLGRLRHELEHAQQRERYGPAFVAACGDTVEALQKRFDDAPDGGRIYNEAPHEYEANLAAGRLLQTTFPDLGTPDSLDHPLAAFFPDQDRRARQASRYGHGDLLARMAQFRSAVSAGSGTVTEFLT
jgi:hypothetical protein